jgi:hypothetical protein
LVKVDTKTLTDKLPFVANSKQSIRLPLEGYVTRYDLKLRINVTTGASGGAPKEDAIARLIKSMRIESAGGKVHFAVADGRQLKYMNYYDLAGQVHEDALPTAANVTADVYAQYYIYWGFNPLNPFDASVVLPARDTQNLVMSVDWGSASDLGSGYTINGGEITITQHQLLLDAGEKVSDLFPYGYVEPRYQATSIAIGAVVTDLKLQDDVPVGDVLRRVIILQLDSADNRSDAEVSELGILLPKERTIPFRIDWKSAVLKDRSEYNLPATITGLLMLDAEDLSGFPAGADLSGFAVGDVKLGFSTLRTGGSIKLAYSMIT